MFPDARFRIFFINVFNNAVSSKNDTDYLKALATEMTSRGAVALNETNARAVVAAVARELAYHGQIEPVGAPTVLATLTAHHIIERLDYPQTAFQFEHQQIQEYYAAFDVSMRLLDLRDEAHDATSRFTANYVNDPAWAEPLRMIAETFAEQTGDGGIDKQNTRAGGKLVEMALKVDLVFAGELAQLCGANVWNEVRTAVGKRFRGIYALSDSNYQQYALAAMLATGADDFTDIIVPLLSGEDQQTRLRVYRLWPDFKLSSLGSNWREQVLTWGEKARATFVSELLHHRVDSEVVAFAEEDNSIAVKKAAVSGLMWNGSEDELTRVLQSMDSQTFEDVARENTDLMPVALRPKTVAAVRKFIESTTDNRARLLAALDLIELGEPGLDDVVKDAMAALPGGDIRDLSSHYIQRTLEHLRKTDPAWVSEWVIIQIAESVLYEHEYWMQFATVIPDGLVKNYLQRLETEDFKHVRLEGMIAMIAACADANLAARVFTKLRDLRHKVDAEPGQRHEFERQVIRQLEDVFGGLSDDVAAAGLLSSVTIGDPLDIKVAAKLLSKVARPDVEPLCIADEDLKASLRAYLKNSIDLVLRQDDFNGEEKANLASSIAQVGKPEDMRCLVTLIRADIERVRHGRAERAAGDSGPLGSGAWTSYSHWHIGAVMHLDPAVAAQVLIDLVHEPEYLSDAADAMARDFLPKPAYSYGPMFRCDMIWTAREDRVPPPADDQRRTRFAAVLNAEIRRLQEQMQNGKQATGLKTLANALAAVDARGSAAAVLDVIAIPGKWDHYVCLDAAERLLMAGVVLPAAIAFDLVDSFLERTDRWMQDSDRIILCRILALCPFVDEPVAGIAKMRDVLGKRRLWGYELRELVTALGESRAVAAIDLLYELASDVQIFEHCEDNFINSIAALDTPRGRELLLGFVDPDIRGIALTGRTEHEEVLIARLAELAERRTDVATRLQELCERDLPDLNRHILSKVMDRIGTPEALAVNLRLIDDAKRWPVPQGVWDHLQAAFIERRPYGQIPNAFTEHARASNELRAELFRMVHDDRKRQKSAFMLLGKIEEWRLEHGRPTGEPRHPNLASEHPWPPREP